jgi:mono/diheme cytochrome c family protein
MKATGFTRFAPYAADLRKFWRGYPEFVRITLNGRTKKRMPPWGGLLDEDEISQIGAYLETLAVEGANWVAY